MADHTDTGETDKFSVARTTGVKSQIGCADSLEQTRLYKIACYVLLNRVVVRSKPGLLPIMMRFPQLIEDSPARLTGG